MATLVKVISGGQSGVDIAALRAAKLVGLDTGGWMPRGYRTLDGPKPEYSYLYGCRQHRERDYMTRTHANVRDADGTLRLAVTFDSQGERCTQEAIVKYRRPSFDVAMDGDLLGRPLTDTPRSLLDRLAAAAAWVTERGIVTLNVAGNSERTAPGIGEIAERYLQAVFKECVRQ